MSESWINSQLVCHHNINHINITIMVSYTKSAFLLCVCLCVDVIKCQVPLFIESRPPPPAIISVGPPLASLALAPSIPQPTKSIPVAPVAPVVPVAPVTKGRLAVKTVVRPPPAQVIEQQEIVRITFIPQTFFFQTFFFQTFILQTFII